MRAGPALARVVEPVQASLWAQALVWSLPALVWESVATVPSLAMDLRWGLARELLQEEG